MTRDLGKDIQCWRSGNNQSVRSSAPVVTRWLWPENRTFSEVDSMVVTWWIACLFCAVSCWSSYYNSSSVCVFVCLFVCSLCPPRSFDGSSPNLVGVCRLTSHLPLRGSFRKGQRVTFTFHYITYAPASRHTAAKGPFCFAAAESNSAPFAALHLNGVCTSTSQLPLRGSFSKRSTGQRVKRVDGSHLDGVCRWTSQLPLRGSFSKRSTDRRVNGSNGSMGQTGRQVNGPLSLSLYYIW